jgi:cytoskeletal protein RodZ
MNQRRVILAVAVVALGSGAIWVWHEGSANTDATPAPVDTPAPVQQSPVQAPDRSVASEVAPASAPPAEPASVAPEDNRSTTGAAVEPPNVDTPEPAARKFANGGRPESDQN